MHRSIRNLLAAASVAAIAGAAAPISFAACGPQDLHGTAMPADSHADRTITITPQTKNVNVTYGETVKFVFPASAGGQQLVWKFDGIANKLTLGDLMQPTASAGASQKPTAAAGTAAKIPVFVDQASNTSTCKD
jgi:hypothetical protein